MTLATIGNDIVDFQLQQDKHLDNRFRRRVFTEKENTIIDESTNNTACLWQLWAAKEAAFKAYQQQHLDCIFSPRLFEINLMTSTAHYGEHSLLLKWQWLNKTTCHALATYRGNKQVLDSTQVHVEKGDYNDPSFSVRRLALSAIKSKYDKVSIKRLPFKMPDGRLKEGPPSFYLYDEKLSISLSLSHDGNYIAMAHVK